MKVDDLFNLEQLGEVRASPDGEWLAIVVARARTAREIYRAFPFDGDLDHADLWLLSLKTGSLRNITNGVADGSGYWNPAWSPDSKRLAMLSTKGGRLVRVFTWDQATGSVSPVSDRAADLQASGSTGYPEYAMIWSDTTTLLFGVLPEGSTQTYFGMTDVMSNTRSWSRAVSEWAKAESGGEATASVLTSGKDTPQAERPVGQLLEADVITGETRVVATGNVRRLLLSPTGRHLALIAETGRTPPAPDRWLPDDGNWDLWRTRLAILELGTTGATAEWFDSIPDPKLALDGTAALHTWSPDGKYLAVIGKGTKDEETATTLFLLSTTDYRARRIADRLAVASTAWSADGRLLALARTARSRLDWWAFDRGGEGPPRNVTMRLKSCPPALLQSSDSAGMLGVADGNLWAIDAATLSVRKQAESGYPRLRGVAWPPGSGLTRRAVDAVLQADNSEYYLLERRHHETRLRHLKRPSSEAVIAEFQPESDRTVFRSTEHSGTFLWTESDSSGRFVRRMALNQQVRTIADVKRMLIEYEGLDGDSLKALLVLPVGYQKGRRYPLVTWVYGGYMVTDTLSYLLDKQRVSALNLYLLASHGYAVLVPSIPLSPASGAAEPYSEVAKGVLGAIDRVIDLGIANPDMLGVLGHSYGGYTAYALVSLTRRFKAAVAIAGVSDLASLYGTFSPPYQHADFPHEDLFQPGLAESGQLRMGDTPWRKPWRYASNSPLYHVDRIATPLMMVHGDMDYVPIQQAEELLTALYRLGKEAIFVRYWGEGHELSSPANIRDMWKRIYAWFDGHLKSGGP